MNVRTMQEETTDLDKVRNKLRSLGSRKRAEAAKWFFKTGPGEYGEGDVFLGIKVPELRALAARSEKIKLRGIRQLLKSPIHEERLLALLLLINLFDAAQAKERRRIFTFYLRHTPWINNWDLVDLSAPRIVGCFLDNQDCSILFALARSKSLWERRIAIVSTFAFIRRGEFKRTFKIARLLLNDEHDLIHKAVGWMLREVGKRHQPGTEKFLLRHYRNMPRTMLRYAIERFPEKKRRAYLLGKV